MDSEEGVNIDGGMKKNGRVEKTVTRFVFGGFCLTCW